MKRKYMKLAPHDMNLHGQPGSSSFAPRFSSVQPHGVGESSVKHSHMGIDDSIGGRSFRPLPATWRLYDSYPFDHSTVHCVIPDSHRLSATTYCFTDALTQLLTLHDDRRRRLSFFSPCCQPRCILARSQNKSRSMTPNLLELANVNIAISKILVL